MKVLFKRWFLLFVLIPCFIGGVFISSASANVMNGDFSAGFDGWTGILGSDPDFDYMIDLEDIGTPVINENFMITGTQATLVNDDWNFGVFLYQDIVVPELATTISFDFDYQPGLPGGFDVFQVLFGGIDLFENWDFFSTSIVADISSLAAGTIARLEFGLIDVDMITGDRFSVGNIQIATAPVPEPGTLLLMVVGLSGLGVIRFRRRNK